jgi:hypothetical protein
VVFVVVFVAGLGVFPPFGLNVKVNALVAVLFPREGVGNVIAENAPVVVEEFQ